ncbi:MAG: Spy/CpxP family protein refolding chaperone [Zoogloea sp.]|nr:Spy/CpxP family protein refolding chaperone [Zoogloea sp.]
MHALTRKLLAGGVAALIMGASGFASAAPQDGGCDGPRHHGGWEHGGPGMMNHEGFQKHVEQRLDKLKDALVLRQDQAPAWNAYRSALTDQAAKAEKRFAAMRDEAAKTRAARDKNATPPKPLAAPERLDRWLEMSKERTASLEQVAAATRKFYATLDAQQQARFDEHFSHDLGRHHPDGRRHPQAPAAAPAPRPAS